MNCKTFVGCWLLYSLLAALPAVADNPPPVSLTTLAREMIDRDGLARLPLPAYRQLQASSWDRNQQLGHPEAWFANHDYVKNFVRIEENAGRREWVLMEDDGPGCVTHIWIPLHPDKWDQVVRFYLDGSDGPAIEAKWNELISGKGLVKPPFALVAAGEDDRPDAGDLYLPIPYAKGCKITLDSEPFYYIINYRAYDADCRVESFTMDTFNAARDELQEIGKTLLENGNVTEGKPIEAEKSMQTNDELAIDLPAGPAAVRTISVEIPADAAPQTLRSTVLEMECDGEPTIWCPIGELFGCGARLRPVADFDRTVEADGKLTCRWVMPYQQGATLMLVNLDKQPLPCKLSATTGPWQWDDRSMHFHAAWHSQYPIATQPRSDWNYVRIQGKGVYVGDTLTVFSHAPQWYGEGDERIYIDGEVFPSHLGTGTEDYYGYAWGMTSQFSSPFLAMPRRDRTGDGDWLSYTTTSRGRALDAIPFNRSLRMDMEIWHWADTQVGYTAGSFFYARPGATDNRPPDAETAAAALPELPPPPPPLVVEGGIEGESLKVLDKSPDISVEPQPLDAHGPERFSKASHLFGRPQKIGDFVELEIPAPGDGPYRLIVRMLKSWDYGVLQFSVGGKPLGDQHDFYSATVEATGPIDLGVVQPVDGVVRLRIEVVDKNPAAKPPGTYFGLDCVELKPVEP